MVERGLMLGWIVDQLTFDEYMEEATRQKQINEFIEKS